MNQQLARQNLFGDTNHFVLGGLVHWKQCWFFLRLLARQRVFSGQFRSVLGGLVLFSVLSLSAQPAGGLARHPEASAEGKATTISLYGTLADPSGAAVAGAHLTLHSDSQSAVTTSDSAGQFRWDNLQAGHYRLRVTHPMFELLERDVLLSESSPLVELRLTLRLEPLSQSVVVTADRLPTPTEAVSAPTTVISGEKLLERETLFVADALAETPGLAFTRTGGRGGQTTVFLRGGNSNFAKVLVDGVTINNPGGFIDLGTLTRDNIEKIEVVRAPESALFGSDAISGVIQVFTRRGASSQPRLELEAEGGKFALARGGANLSGLAGRLDYSIAASRIETEGQEPNSGFRDTALSANFGYRFSSDNQLRLTLRDSDGRVGVPGQTLLAPPNLTQFAANRQFSAGLSWDFRTGENWQHHLAGTEANLRRLNADPDGFFPFRALDRINRVGFEYQTNYFLKGDTITFGYQFEDENAFLSDFHAKRLNHGVYVQNRWQPVARLTITAGARLEVNDSYGTRGVPRVGIAYALRQGSARGDEFWGGTRIRFYYGLGIQEPDLLTSFGQDPCFPGNPNLRPERSRTFNVGVQQQVASGKYTVELDYFDNRFLDLISFGALPAPPGCEFGAGTFFNTDRSRALGGELVLRGRPNGWLSLEGHYSYLDSLVQEANSPFLDPQQQAGNRLLRRPLHSGALFLNATFRGMNWNLAGRFVGPRTDDDFRFLGIRRNPGYARWDLGLSYRLGRGTTLFSRLENLFDKKYQDVVGYPALRRNYRAGIRWAMGGK